MTPQRFTIDGSDALESHLAAVCSRVLRGVREIVSPNQLEAILLGGGYGRGEGGVRSTPTGDAPYNDLEFYVMVRGHRLLVERRFGEGLSRLGHQLSSEAGLEVEFKVMTLAQLRCSPPNMFFYDLVAGHRWLLGEEHLLQGCEHHRDPARIPLHEATRLLLNRASGLLFSAERLRRPAFGLGEADFVGRNLAKAQLAFGDVLLAAFGQYCGSCIARAQRLEVLVGKLAEPWVQTVLRHHRVGIEFKLHPQASNASRERLAERHAELSSLGLTVWLWLENRRLGQSFASAAEYALWPHDLCPHTRAWKNLVLNLRLFGLRLPPSLQAFRYPRERLLRALPLLLWDAGNESGRWGHLQKLLASPESDFPGLVRAYHAVWQHFN